GGESHSHRERHVRRDNRVAAIHVALFVEIMHRPAESARATTDLAEQLGHAGVGTCSSRQSVGVIPISSDQVIVRAYRGDRANDDRLLPDVEMAKAADL